MLKYGGKIGEIYKSLTTNKLVKLIDIDNWGDEDCPKFVYTLEDIKTREVDYANSALELQELVLVEEILYGKK